MTIDRSIRFSSSFSIEFNIFKTIHFAYNTTCLKIIVFIFNQDVGTKLND